MKHIAYCINIHTRNVLTRPCNYLSQVQSSQMKPTCFLLSFVASQLKAKHRVSIRITNIKTTELSCVDNVYLCNHYANMFLIIDLVIFVHESNVNSNCGISRGKQSSETKKYPINEKTKRAREYSSGTTYSKDIHIKFHNEI